MATKQVSQTFLVDVASELTAADLERIRQQYGIPEGIELIVPTPEQRANQHEKNRLCLHEECLKVGITFPFEGLIETALNTFDVAPSQLAPNAWRVLHALDKWSEANEYVISGPMLGQLLALKKSGDFLTLQSRGPKVVGGLPSSNKGWKPRFFFARRLSKGEATRWNVPTSWYAGNSLKNPPPVTAEGEKETLATITAGLEVAPIPFDQVGRFVSTSQKRKSPASSSPIPPSPKRTKTVVSKTSKTSSAIGRKGVTIAQPLRAVPGKGTSVEKEVRRALQQSAEEEAARQREIEDEAEQLALALAQSAAEAGVRAVISSSSESGSDSVEVVAETTSVVETAEEEVDQPDSPHSPAPAGVRSPRARP